jgi:hypothetical protein
MARPRLPVPSAKINVKFHLRPGEDDDLIRFFAALPPHRRAAALKVALRSGGMAQAAAEGLPDDAALTDALLESELVF